MYPLLLTKYIKKYWYKRYDFSERRADTPKTSTANNKIVLLFSECPEEPSNVILSVVSSSALLVSYDDPISHNGAVVTGYKGRYFRCFCLCHAFGLHY